MFGKQGNEHEKNNNHGKLLKNKHPRTLGVPKRKHETNRKIGSSCFETVKTRRKIDIDCISNMAIDNNMTYKFISLKI